jgi:hypothetical protein
VILCGTDIPSTALRASRHRPRPLERAFFCQGLAMRSTCLQEGPIEQADTASCSSHCTGRAPVLVPAIRNPCGRLIQHRNHNLCRGRTHHHRPCVQDIPRHPIGEKVGAHKFELPVADLNTRMSPSMRLRIAAEKATSGPNRLPREPATSAWHARCKAQYANALETLAESWLHLATRMPRKNTPRPFDLLNVVISTHE